MRRQGHSLAFEPVMVGRSECEAWVGYYRRNWPRMLAGLLGMVRYGFALGPLGNLKAAWHVLRGSQAWAPYSRQRSRSRPAPHGPVLSNGQPGRPAPRRSATSPPNWRWPGGTPIGRAA